MEITSEDFENFADRARALIQKQGVAHVARLTGLSESAVRRIGKSTGDLPRMRGITAMRLMVVLKGRKVR